MQALGLVYSEWLKGRGRPVEKYVGAIAVAFGVIIPLIMLFISRRDAGMRAIALNAMSFPSSLSSAGAALILFGPLCAAALGANVAGTEYQYGTWPWMLVRSSGRGPLFIAKVAVGAARIVALAI